MPRRAVFLSTLIYSAPVFLLLLVTVDTVSADWKDDIGFVALQAQLGVGIPTGLGVDVSQVESDVDGGAADNYLLDIGNAEFSGKTITDATASSATVSNHATTVGRHFFGNTSSIAPGVTNITAYDANDYLDNVLNFFPPSMIPTTPGVQTTKVQSHAWVGDGTTDAITANLLSRLDYSIDRDEFTAIVGMPNSGDGVQPLLGHGFNSIAVGLTNGTHVTGPTSPGGYGPGRVKPDLVAPGTTTSPGTTYTSWATGQTASAAALLHEVGSGDAVKSETLKAILMTGATKDDVNGVWSHTATEPLDATFGAGELDIQNSYWVLAAGEQEGTNGAGPASPVGDYGWDYEATFNAALPRYYNLDIPIGMTASELSVSLNWNADVDTSTFSGQGDPTFTFANMDLRIYDSSSTFKGMLVDESVSTDHNLEHLYLTNLAAGTYTLEVTSDTNRDFGLAWRMTTVPEPTASLLLIPTLLGIALRRRYT